jgi:glycosyltransferase involved in cell wall biosynthesis
MRLYFVTSHYGNITNGPGRFADYFVRYVQTQCPSISLTVISSDKGKSRYGEDVVHIERSTRRGSTITTALKVYRYLNNEIRKGNVDSIYYNSPNCAILLPKGAMIYMNFNDYYNAELEFGDILRYSPYKILYKLFWNRIEKRHCNRTTTIFANSQYTANSIASSYNVKPEKVIITYKGVDLNTFHRDSEQKDMSIAKICFVGSDYKRKGLFNAIKVVEILINHYNCSCEFTIIGSYKKKQIEKIDKKLRTSRISEKTKMLGAHFDLAKRFNTFDFLLIPAKQEAFGVAILEALASGVIVIASDTGGIPELVSDGKDGFLFPHDDIKGMALTIYELVHNQEKVQALIYRGIEKSTLFTIDKVTENIISIMRNHHVLGTSTLNM